MENLKIILASGSRDRAKSFERAQLDFEIFISDFSEDKLKSKELPPIELAKELAKGKALDIKKKMEFKGIDAIIIAADTLVEFEGKIIGKAMDENHALKILKNLNNNTHNLISAIAITRTFNDKIISDCDITIVRFIDLSIDEIKAYIKTGEWKERAGAYSIRNKASLFIDKIEGSPSNVIGIPMHKLFLILKNEFNYNLLSKQI